MGKKRIDHSSTDPEASFDSPFAKLAGLREALPEGEAAVVEAAPAPPKQDGLWPPKLVVRRERRGRGGHTVTVIEGFSTRTPELDELAQRLKKSLGVGARWQEGGLVVQGDVDERVRDWLLEAGAKKVVLGSR